MSRFALVLALAGLAAQAQAQELAIGVGTTDYGDQGTDSFALELDYRHTPFRTWRKLSFALGATANVTGEGDYFVGIGPSTRLNWDNGWFVETRLMIGYYNAGTPGNDLGSDYQFRSLLGAGYTFENGQSVSLGLSHKSNAGLADDNPGMNSYLLRYHFPF